MKYSCIDNIVAIEEIDTQNVEKFIEEFESKYNLKLPEQYRKFMIEYNGGKTNNVYFGKDIENVEVLLREFLSFGKFEEYGEDTMSEFEYENSDKILEQKFGFETILPYREMIMIGWDDGDNSILISCEDYDYGKIYIQDHEDREYFKITKLTNSFNEFIEGLKHNTTLPGNLGREINIKRAKSSEELAEILEDFRKIDEKRNKPIYRELKVDIYI